MGPPAAASGCGFQLAAYPLESLTASIVGMRRTLESIAATGKPPTSDSMPFHELQRDVGFPEYYDEEER